MNIHSFLDASTHLPISPLYLFIHHILFMIFSAGV